MVSQIQPSAQPEVIYPDSDGQPVANNTIQFGWIVEIKQNLDWLFADDPNVFVAGDLFWYPVEAGLFHSLKVLNLQAYQSKKSGC
ncbi:hypothetical protein [Nostoc sp. DedQUE09]|uniref:hypothetical protein n=1 Tax=Nostoc sp. DedQUE09 TaxID=3075394 RepID=UPI003A0FE98D